MSAATEQDRTSLDSQTLRADRLAQLRAAMARHGIDAVIVDSVLKVRKGLTDAEAVRAQHGNGISTLGNGMTELKV